MAQNCTESKEVFAVTVWDMVYETCSQLEWELLRFWFVSFRQTYFMFIHSVLFAELVDKSYGLSTNQSIRSVSFSVICLKLKKVKIN